MAFTATPLTTTSPSSPGNRRRWVGTITVDNSYLNGTGFTVPATIFGLVTIDLALFSISTNLLYDSVFVSGGANLVFKSIVNTTGVELGSTGGAGAVIP